MVSCRMLLPILALVALGSGEDYDVDPAISLLQARASIMTAANATSRSTSESSTPSISIHIINLKERDDKCECMRSQLQYAPYPVHKYKAIHGDEVAEKCPAGFMDDDDKDFQSLDDKGVKRVNTHALTCSNLNLWKELMHRDEDIFIVFEDDVALRKDAWERFDTFLKEGCQEWDYLMVDPFGPQGQKFGKTEVENPIDSSCPAPDGMRVDGLTLGHAGTHMQVIRKTAIPKLVEFILKSSNKHEVFQQDQLVVNAIRRGYDIRAGAGFLNIVRQWSTQSSWTTQHIEKDKCPHTVGSHDRNPYSRTRTFELFRRDLHLFDC